ncbi:hypothetical protein MNBD_GAMMA14-2156 [hydrothermal vent metagenome]|uniref:Uncharacterized protein n=1 Tax=hydrothermal vent metagenome TaxID=652676 RepID=A0A3B0ZKK1_9ZZZZ
MKHMKLNIVLFAVIFTISACGGGTTSAPESNSSPSSSSTWPASGKSIPPDSYGVLLDSAVEGLRYKSGGHYGVTDSNGRFGYIFGENIEFYIGNSLIAYTDIPTELLTPYELSSNGPFSTVDVLRLLQSLDDDGDANNGIKIIDATHQLAESVKIEPNRNFNIQFDMIDSSVITKLTSVTSAGTRGITSAYDAYFHFATTLDKLIDDKEDDIQSLADQTTCTTSEQCDIIELDTKFTYYCPDPGTTITYSVNDIDQSQIDILVAERKYFIGVKQDVKYLVGATNTGTGFCISARPPISLVCNLSNRCEIRN